MEVVLRREQENILVTLSESCCARGYERLGLLEQEMILQKICDEAGKEN